MAATVHFSSRNYNAPHHPHSHSRMLTHAQAQAGTNSFNSLLQQPSTSQRREQQQPRDYQLIVESSHQPSEESMPEYNSQLLKMDYTGHNANQIITQEPHQYSVPIPQNDYFPGPFHPLTQDRKQIHQFDHRNSANSSILHRPVLDPSNIHSQYSSHNSQSSEQGNLIQGQHSAQSQSLRSIGQNFSANPSQSRFSPQGVGSTEHVSQSRAQIQHILAHPQPHKVHTSFSRPPAHNLHGSRLQTPKPRGGYGRPPLHQGKRPSVSSPCSFTSVARPVDILNEPRRPSALLSTQQTYQVPSGRNFDRNNPSTAMASADSRASRSAGKPELRLYDHRDHSRLQRHQPMQVTASSHLVSESDPLEAAPSRLMTHSGSCALTPLANINSRPVGHSSRERQGRNFDGSSAQLPNLMSGLNGSFDQSYAHLHRFPEASTCVPTSLSPLIPQQQNSVADSRFSSHVSSCYPVQLSAGAQEALDSDQQSHVVNFVSPSPCQIVDNLPPSASQILGPDLHRVSSTPTGAALIPNGEVCLSSRYEQATNQTSNSYTHASRILESPAPDIGPSSFLIESLPSQSPVSQALIHSGRAGHIENSFIGPSPSLAAGTQLGSSACRQNILSQDGLPSGPSAPAQSPLGIGGPAEAQSFPGVQASGFGVENAPLSQVFPSPHPGPVGPTHAYSPLMPTPPLSLQTPLQQQQQQAGFQQAGHRLNSFGTQSNFSALPVSESLINVSGLAQVPVTVDSNAMYESQMALGCAYRNMGRHDYAVDAFRSAACLRPDSSEARACFASACHEQGLYETAITEFAVALELGPSYPDDIYNNMGNTFRAMGRSTEAEIAYRTALSISPRHAHAWNNLGNAMRARGAFADAVSCYTASLSSLTGFAAAHCNLAGLLRDQGKPQEAENHYRQALVSDPNLAEAAAGLGTALRDMGRAEEAIAFYKKAVYLQPNGADHHANLANTYKDLNRIEDSIRSYQSALALQRDMPDAFCNMVHSLCVICDWRNRDENFASLLDIIDKQLDALLRHPSTSPKLYNALVGALTNSTPQLVNVSGGSRSERDGNTSITSREENSAEVHRRRTRMRHPSSPLSSTKGNTSHRIQCESSVNPPSEVKSVLKKSSAFSAAQQAVIAPVLATGLPSVQPFHALIYPMSPEKFRALSSAYASRAESLVSGLPKARKIWTPPVRPGGRLKVGYVSSDYNNHPYSHLTQSIYGLHTTGRSVECFCYALTPSDNSLWRLRIERESEHFRDISSLDAQQSAQAIANDGIHVLVNCNGYTKGARTELFALRPAPVQVSFMGFPGTLGAHYIEYFITDLVTSPPHLASRMHSEALLYHPHSYFVNDHRQTSVRGPANYPSGPLTRAHYGLPENCFLFIMHNQVYKIDPKTFDVWARILKRVPSSKLWLLKFPPSAEACIREEARARGLERDRLIFTDVAGKEEHVARCGLGDLFLDTPTCNAHTTGTDALWSGVPLLTCPGSLFASRVAASLLTAAGVPELIAKDMYAYEEIAVELATNPAKLAAIRARIESSRDHNPLFDTTRWVRNVERLYWQAWQNFECGRGPQHIFGKDIHEEEQDAAAIRYASIAHSTAMSATGNTRMWYRGNSASAIAL